MSKSLTLEIITQEKHVETETVSQVTAMTEAGEVTILPDHVPLFSRLKPGELRYITPSGIKAVFAVTGGFMDVSPRNIVTILADTALRSDQINLQKAQEAVERAQKALENSQDIKDTLKIELELRQALLQSRIAKKYQQSNQS